MLPLRKEGHQQHRNQGQPTHTQPQGLRSSQGSSAQYQVLREPAGGQPQYQRTDQPEIYKVLAAQVNNHLFAEADKSYLDSDISKQTVEQIEQVLPHVAKWADDAMTQDPDLRELVVQTLRMEAIIEQVKHGVTDYLKTEKGARVAKLLHVYGGQVATTPNSKSYSQLSSTPFRRHGF
jgi:hypothetical protein